MYTCTSPVSCMCMHQIFNITEGALIVTGCISLLEGYHSNMTILTLFLLSLSLAGSELNIQHNLHSKLYAQHSGVQQSWGPLCMQLLSHLARASCIQGLPDAAYITSMAEDIVNSSDYAVIHSRQFIFTSVKFECSGAITGWTTLAQDGTGRGRPEISVWSPSAGSLTFTKYNVCMGLL